MKGLMKKELEILIIEDTPADYLLIIRQLREDGLSIRCRCVSSADELKQALGMGGWEVVLSDFNIPKLDFLESLSLVQERLPGVPVILVSGCIGEEKAVELLKLGVCDFVLKDRLTRLVPAIERSLKEASERHARKMAERALRASEKALRKSEALLRRAERIAHLGHWRIDLKTNTLTWSDEMYRIFGADPGQFRLTQESFLELVHPADRESVIRLSDYFLEGDNGHFEYRVIRPDGTLRYLSGVAEIVRDRRDAPEAIFGTAQDITELRRNERELREKNVEMERFTYIVSHDLRNPLITIKTFLGYLAQDVKENNPVRIHQDLSYMNKAADRMGYLLDELLELSRIGRVVSSPEMVTVREVVDSALTLVAEAISEKPVEIRLDLAPVNLYADRHRLGEIWQNLLENAVKFMGDQPRPVIEIGTEGTGLDTVFFVRDNGMGIEQPHHEKIFGLFEKLDGNSQGSGIGLALVSRIVDMYRGTVWVESDGPGCGACFRFTLPEACSNFKNDIQLKDGSKFQ